jgi:hypothetical protein
MGEARGHKNSVWNSYEILEKGIVVVIVVVFCLDCGIKILSVCLIKTYFGLKILDKGFVHLLDLIESTIPLALLYYRVDDSWYEG